MKIVSIKDIRGSIIKESKVGIAIDSIDCWIVFVWSDIASCSFFVFFRNVVILLHSLLCFG